MTATLNLVDDPWIHCLDSGGRPHVLSLRDVISDAEHLWIAEINPLVEAAIWRLLTAICYAAGAHPPDMDAYIAQINDGLPTATIVSYLDVHSGQFALFDPRRPFGQDAALRAAIESSSLRPALYLDMTAAIDRPLHADTRHLLNTGPLTPHAALCALLMQNLWGFGGLTPGSPHDLKGFRPTNGVPAPVNGRLVLCPAGSSVAAGLSWRVIPATTPGTPTWTYPTDPVHTTTALPSEAGGLTWLSRRLLLVPDQHGMVSGMLIARGQTYQDIASQDDMTGWSDVVMGAATALPASAITSTDDLVPVVASFAQARPGSLASYLLAAADTLNTGIDLVAIGVVAAVRGQSKPMATHRVPIPAAALESSALQTAQTLLTLRADTSASPLGADTASYLRWLHRPGQDAHDLVATVRRRSCAALIMREPVDPAAHARAALKIYSRTPADTRQLDTPPPTTTRGHRAVG